VQLAIPSHLSKGDGCAAKDRHLSRLAVGRSRQRRAPIEV